MISIMTLNVRFGLAEDGNHRWDCRREAFVDLFRRYRADFIGLQEVNHFQADFFRKILPGYDCIGQRWPSPKFWQSNVLFYKRRWKCRWQELFFFSPTPSIPSRFRKSRWPRQCVIGHFSDGTRRMVCVNTHFDFDEEVQTKSARMILDRLGRFPCDEAAVVVGDFNATPDSACFSTLSAELSSVFTHPYPGTFHGFTGNSGKKHIDWILFRGGLQPEHAQVVKEPINGVYPSDHFPVHAVLRMRPRC